MNSARGIRKTHQSTEDYFCTVADAAKGRDKARQVWLDVLEALNPSRSRGLQFTCMAEKGGGHVDSRDRLEEVSPEQTLRQEPGRDKRIASNPRTAVWFADK